MRSSARLLAVLLVAGCASTPDDPLVWSDDVVRTLPRERGEVVEVARFSRLRAGDSLAPWEPWIILRGNTPTSYRLVEVDGVAALEGNSAEGGSGMWRKIRIDPQAQPLMEWRWRVPAEVETRLEKNSSASPPVRLSLAFHGDPAKLDFEDRVKLRMARALTVNGLPYASLLYVWMVGVPVDTVLHSPHTDRVRLIVVESGVRRAGSGSPCGATWWKISGARSARTPATSSGSA
jgi:hypothetical protein